MIVFAIEEVLQRNIMPWGETKIYMWHAKHFCRFSLRWRHNDHAGVSNHQPHGCLLNRLFRRKSKKTSKLRVTGLCAGNSPETGEFPAQMASYAENVSIWWRHHVKPNKNIVKHIARAYKQWLMIHTSDLMVIIRRRCLLPRAFSRFRRLSGTTSFH